MAMKTEARVIQQDGKVGIRKAMLTSDGAVGSIALEQLSPEFNSIADLESWLEDVVTSLQRPAIKCTNVLLVKRKPPTALFRKKSGAPSPALSGQCDRMLGKDARSHVSGCFETHVVIAANPTLPGDVVRKSDSGHANGLTKRPKQPTPFPSELDL